MSFVEGVGMTRFGVDDRPAHLIAYEAASDALADAERSFDEIDAVVVSSQHWAFGDRQRHLSAMLAGLFSTTKPIVEVPAACGGGGAALWHASRLGYDNVLVVGVERLSQGSSAMLTDEFMMASDPRYERDEGLIFPARGALIAQDYMARYELTLDDLALIAKRSHDNALLNPKARFFGKPVTLSAIRSSPVVASPLRLHDCAANADGAAACVLSSDRSDVELAGIDLRTDHASLIAKQDLTTWQANVESARRALDQAGLAPSDIDVAELHDAFTIYEVVACEDIGFTRRGRTAEAVRAGLFERDGRLPLNVSGGLKARGHPLSATGLAQVYELVTQLRGQADERQVEGVKTALAHNVGGSGGTVTTSVLKRR